MSVRRFAYISIVLALASSGAYIFVYLYRWEWNRALIAGVFFIASEIALIGALILQRLKGIEERIGRRTSPIDETTLAHIKDAAPERSSPFAWLVDRESDLNVFIPVLLGAGLLVSGLAWVVERIASATARPVLERGLARKLAPISLTSGALTGAPIKEKPVAARAWMPQIMKVIAVALVVFAAVRGIDMLSDLTQSRPDVVRDGTQSTVLLDVDTRHGRPEPLTAAHSLWGACANTTYAHLAEGGISVVAGNRVSIALEPSLGSNAQTKLHGCLEDAVLSRIQGNVVRVMSTAP